MQLKLKDILKNLTSEDIIQINVFFAKEIISEKQFLRVLIKSFNLHAKSDEIEIKTEVYRALFILKFIDNINLKNIDSRKHKETIKRLMSDNGNETVNELFCHYSLSTFFKNYTITNLYENLPDGYIIDKELQFPIEIKSRFPEIFDRLSAFFSSMTDLWPVLDSKDLTVQIRILKLNKQINTTSLNSEIEFIKKKVSEIRFNDLPLYPNWIKLKKTSALIEYVIEIFCNKSKNEYLLYITQEQLASCIHLTTKCTFIGEKISGICLFYMTIEDEVSHLLSDIVVNECLNNIKNMPPEPRGIIIYSNILGSNYLQKFFSLTIEKYIQNNSRTMVIGICGSFNERKENSINIIKMEVGKDIKELISKYFRPEVLI